MNLRDLSKPRTGDRRKARVKPGRKRGRPKGALSKATIEKTLKAQRALLKSAQYKIATEHMDEQIGKLEGLVALLYPFDEAGDVRKGKDTSLYFHAFDLFRDFLCMRAPYQSPRLSAVQVVPAQARQQTTVNVTILNERGEQVYSDSENPPGNAKLIENEPMVPAKDEEAA
jgi:hypothetical protein